MNNAAFLRELHDGSSSLIVFDLAHKETSMKIASRPTKSTRHASAAKSLSTLAFAMMGVLGVAEPIGLTMILGKSCPNQGEI